MTTEAQAAAQDEGNQRHARFHEEGRQLAAAGSGRRWCFVAALVLGECEETRQLRAYRDVVLRRTPFGRALVLAYYRVAPGTCRQLERWPRAILLLRAPLRVAAKWAQRRVERRIEKEASNVANA